VWDDNARLQAKKIALTLVDFEPAPTSAPGDVTADVLLSQRMQERPVFYAMADQILAPVLAQYGELRVGKGKVSFTFSSPRQGEERPKRSTRSGLRPKVGDPRLEAQRRSPKRRVGS
jgi:hypothetical protein